MAKFNAAANQILMFDSGCAQYPSLPEYHHETLGADYDSIVNKTFTFEGGYQNYSNDSANYNSRGELVGTNRGISAIAYETYLNRPPSVADMKAITATTAKKVYKKLFWDFMRGDQIKNDSVAHIMFDSFIATGNLKLVRQGINKVSSTKVTEKHVAFNDFTVRVVNGADQKALFNSIKDLNIQQRKALAEANPSKYAMFLKGWLARLDKITFTQAAIGIGTGVFFF
ncbi:MAG: hypothetical protein EP332_06355 [Bacteroidetes bacterium]|nr:MAG: hypothetical protein EP332_06355 [Bacteroidota bacterium]